MRQVSDATFESEVLKAPGYVLVDFWAQWCGPCKAIAPVLDEVEAATGGRVAVAKADVEETPRSAGQFGVRNLPTLVLFRDGKPVAVKTGAMPRQALLAWVAGAAA